MLKKVDRPKADVIDDIRAEHRKRLFLIKQRTRNTNALGAYIRRDLGWSADLPEKERETIRKKAEQIIKTNGAGTTFEEIIAAHNSACATFDKVEADIEKTLKKLVRELPVWKSWGKNTLGISELGIATIVGEAGDLSNYPKKGHLFQRMGVGFVDGERQGNLPATAPASEWIRHAYNRQRRSRLYAYVGVPIIKCTEREETDTSSARPASPYREAYDQRRTYEIAKAEAAGFKVAASKDIPAGESENYVSDMCIHRRAQRYMEQRLLKHLLQAWKRAE